MSITISPPLIWFIVNGIGWTLAALVFLVLLYGVIWYLIYALKNRRVFGCARVWLTTKNSRYKANEYTYHALRQIAEILEKENPALFGRIGKLFIRSEANLCEVCGTETDNMSEGFDVYLCSEHGGTLPSHIHPTNRTP
jgi:hypothetical protein